MGWSAEFGGVGMAAVVLYLGAIAWTVGYDTIYAYQDKEDDELIGVRSTARRFGEHPRPWLFGLYGLTVLLLCVSFATAGAGLLAFVGLLVATVMLFYQILVLDIHDAAQCLALFKFNGVVGLIVFGGLLAALLVRLL
jgi:4-hydroxybenzoate polyprenyltransferase